MSLVLRAAKQLAPFKQALLDLWPWRARVQAELLFELHLWPRPR